MISFFPVDLYDIAGAESYLHDMAAKGYFLTELGLFAHYDKGEPKKVTYRIEPKMRKEFDPPSVLVDGYKENGWHYICEASRMFYIFASYDEVPVELHTEPIIQSYAFGYLQKTTKFSALISIGCIAVIICFFLWSLIDTKYFYKYLIGSQGRLWIYIFYCILLFDLMVFLRQNKRIKDLVKSLKSGNPMKHRARYRKSYATTIIIISFGLYYIVNFISLGLWDSRVWSKPLEEYNGVLPTVLVEEMEAVNVEIQKPYDGYPGDINYHNSISYEWSELAPIMVEVNQDTIADEGMWADGSGKYSPNIDAKYYELRFSLLRSPLLKDLIAYDGELYGYDEIVSKELMNTEFDYAYLVKIDEMQYLYAYVGNKVIDVRYQGYENLEDYVDEIANRVLNFEMSEKNGN